MGTVRFSITTAQLLILVGLSVQSSVAMAGLNCVDIFYERTITSSEVSVLFHLMRMNIYSFKTDPFLHTDIPKRLQKEVPGFLREFPMVANDSKLYTIAYRDMPNSANLKQGDVIRLEWMLPVFPENSQIIALGKQTFHQDLRQARAGWLPMVLVSVKGKSGRSLEGLDLHFPKEDPSLVFLPGTQFRVSFTKEAGLEVLELTEISE